MIVLIDGEGASGKTVLRSLLDGHPELSVLPIHDMFVDNLCNHPPDVPWLQRRDMAYLRGLLASSQYYQLESAALHGGIEFDISVRERVTIPFDFDFWRFDELWVRRLAAADEWTIGSIVETLHRSYLEVFEGGDRAVRGYVGVGFDDPATPLRLFDRVSDAKLIYLRRPIEGIIATRANRTSSATDVGSLEHDRTTVESLLRKDKVRKIRDRLARAEALAAARPDRARIVDFQRLVEDSTDVMTELAEFIGIAYTPSLVESTLAGVPLVSAKGNSYVGRVLDRPEDLLDRRDRALIAVEKDRSMLLRPDAWRQPAVAAFAIRQGLRRGARAAAGAVLRRL